MSYKVGQGKGNLPSILNSDGDFSFYVKSSSVPKVEIDQAEVAFLSQKFVIPKQVKYGETWTCKILLNGNIEIYKALYDWQEEFASLKNNGGGIKVIPNVNATVKLLDQTFNIGSPKNRFTLVGVFPSNIPKIDLQYENQASIVEVDCTLTYQYMYHDEVDISDPLSAGSN